MDEDTVKQILESYGYPVSSTTSFSEGRSHYCFNIILDGDISIIARFEKNDTPLTIGGIRRDFHYNGQLSLERETNLCEIVREEARLPAPKVYGLHRTKDVSFMLVEKLPGVHWKKYLEDTDYDLDNFLKSMYFLGRDIAQAQQVHFASYGDIISRNNVSPAGISEFRLRLSQIISLKLQRAEHSNSLTERETAEITSYFRRDFDRLNSSLRTASSPPVLILTDLHPMNFLVDANGKPSGYFDLEFCQSGVPALEFYPFRMNLFNYFDASTFLQAEDAFFRGFEDNEGSYDRFNEGNIMLERILAIGHLFSAVVAYHDASDGLRNTWSQQFKDIMFNAIVGKDVDYNAVADVLRAKTKQPKHPKIKS